VLAAKHRLTDGRSLLDRPRIREILAALARESWPYGRRGANLPLASNTLGRKRLNNTACGLSRAITAFAKGYVSRLIAECGACQIAELSR